MRKVVAVKTFVVEFYQEYAQEKKQGMKQNAGQPAVPGPGRYFPYKCFEQYQRKNQAYHHHPNAGMAFEVNGHNNARHKQDYAA